MMIDFIAVKEWTCRFALGGSRDEEEEGEGIQSCAGLDGDWHWVIVRVFLQAQSG